MTANEACSRRGAAAISSDTRVPAVAAGAVDAAARNRHRPRRRHHRRHRRRRRGHRPCLHRRLRRRRRRRRPRRRRRVSSRLPPSSPRPSPPPSPPASPPGPSMPPQICTDAKVRKGEWVSEDGGWQCPEVRCHRLPRPLPGNGSALCKGESFQFCGGMTARTCSRAAAAIASKAPASPPSPPAPSTPLPWPPPSTSPAPPPPSTASPSPPPPSASSRTRRRPPSLDRRQFADARVQKKLPLLGSIAVEDAAAALGIALGPPSASPSPCRRRRRGWCKWSGFGATPPCRWPS